MKITRCDRCDHDIEDGERALRLVLSDAMNTRAEAYARDLCEPCADIVRSASQKPSQKDHAFVCESVYGTDQCELDDGHEGPHQRASMFWAASVREAVSA